LRIKAAQRAGDEEEDQNQKDNVYQRNQVFLMGVTVSALT